MTAFNPDDFLHRKTLILGDVNTGKTTLARSVLEAFCRKGLGQRIVIVDMAPEIKTTPAGGHELAGVGGKLTPPEGWDVLYLGGRFEPPRLSSKTEEEALRKARLNQLKIELLLREADHHKRDILFINDASMYLQAGSAEDLTARIAAADTAVVNGYWGKRLGGGIVSERERAEMAQLKSYFHEQGMIVICPPM